MRIEYTTKNYKESARLTEVVEKKLSKLDKYFGEGAVAKVKLSAEKSGFTMEITIYRPGVKTPLRSEVTTDNMYDNIDIILPRIEKQILKYRTRMVDRKKDGRALPVVNVPGEVAPAEEKASYGKVVKVKNFAISIITVEEAIAELELLDHNFYVFVNAEDNKVSIVYKRDDGDYGLIVPEY
jgi:ribosomal subunit interface protein